MIAVIKYNAGNTRSVLNALNRLGVEGHLTNNPGELKKADKVIFPGVGEASSAMQYLKKAGLDEVLKNLNQPFLGICLGMQLMCSFTEEGNTTCLGVFDEKVKKFPAKNKIPHMGWNDFTQSSSPLFSHLNNQSNMYFVHSYYAEIGTNTIAETNYILPFSAALQKDNFFGVQFHPEKSANAGKQLLKNFLEL